MMSLWLLFYLVHAFPGFPSMDSVSFNMREQEDPEFKWGHAYCQASSPTPNGDRRQRKVHRADLQTPTDTSPHQTLNKNTYLLIACSWNRLDLLSPSSHSRHDSRDAPRRVSFDMLQGKHVGKRWDVGQRGMPRPSGWRAFCGWEHVCSSLSHVGSGLPSIDVLRCSRHLHGSHHQEPNPSVSALTELPVPRKVVGNPNPRRGLWNGRNQI